MKVASSLRASARASGTVRVSALPMVAERMRPRTLRRRKNERCPLVPTRRPRPEITSSHTSYFLARALAARTRRAKVDLGWSVIGCGSCVGPRDRWSK